MKNKVGKLVLFFAFGILVYAVWSNVAAYAQNKTATSVAAPPVAPKQQQHITKIKISSPTKGQQVPVGKDLTVSGTSIDNATSNDCKVTVIVNKVRPYQPVTPSGTAAAAGDYSKWNFVLTSKYTTIKPGQNRITAKYDCTDNPALNSFSSVNVTGVTGGVASTSNATKTTTTITAPAKTTAIGTTTKTTAPAKTMTTTASAAPKQPQQHIVTTKSNSPASVPNSAGVQRVSPVSNVNNKLLSSPSSIAPQVKSASQENAVNQKPHQLTTVSNGTAGQTSMLSSPPPMVTSDKLMYLGYHRDNTNNDLTGKSTMSTKPVSKHSSSSSITNTGAVDIIKSSHHKDSNTSTSQISTNRNTDNGNNNFIFPFSYP